MNPNLRKIVNANALIRVTYTGCKSQLVGAGQLHKHLKRITPDELAERFLSCGLDRYTIKLRKRVKIEFLSK